MNAFMRTLAVLVVVCLLGVALPVVGAKPAVTVVNAPYQGGESDHGCYPSPCAPVMSFDPRWGLLEFVGEASGPSSREFGWARMSALGFLPDTGAKAVEVEIRVFAEGTSLASNGNGTAYASAGMHVDVRHEECGTCGVRDYSATFVDALVGSCYGCEDVAPQTTSGEQVHSFVLQNEDNDVLPAGWFVFSFYFEVQADTGWGSTPAGAQPAHASLDFSLEVIEISLHVPHAGGSPKPLPRHTILETPPYDMFRIEGCTSGCGPSGDPGSGEYKVALRGSSFRYMVLDHDVEIPVAVTSVDVNLTLDVREAHAMAESTLGDAYAYMTLSYRVVHRGCQTVGCEAWVRETFVSAGDMESAGEEPGPASRVPGSVVYPLRVANPSGAPIGPGTASIYVSMWAWTHRSTQDQLASSAVETAKAEVSADVRFTSFELGFQEARWPPM